MICTPTPGFEEEEEEGGDAHAAPSPPPFSLGSSIE